jgi:transposase
LELLLVRKWTDKERTYSRDRLGLNAHQFATEIHQPFLIPFILAQDDTADHIYLAADGATWHYGGENKWLREEIGYLQLPWSTNSPDLNPIENVWMPLKRQLGKYFSTVELRPHSEAELFAAAREEWAQIPQDVIDMLIDSMPERLQAVLDADGGSTKW